EGVLGINVKGGAEPFHQRFERHAFAIELPADITEIMHEKSLEGRRRRGKWEEEGTNSGTVQPTGSCQMTVRIMNPLQLRSRALPGAARRRILARSEPWLL